jgi:hypothetical protein
MPECVYKSVIIEDIDGNREKVSIAACKPSNNKDVVTAGKMYSLTKTYESEVQKDANYLPSTPHNIIEDNSVLTENSLTHDTCDEKQSPQIDESSNQLTQVVKSNKKYSLVIQSQRQKDVEVYQKSDFSEFSVVSNDPNSDLDKIIDEQIQELTTSEHINAKQADLLREVETIDLDDAVFNIIYNKMSDGNYIEM